MKGLLKKEVEKLEDEKIIELFFSRNECAVSEVKEKYGKLLLGASKRLLRSESDSEECLNDTLMALWDTIPPQKPDSLRAYALRLIRNISLNRLKYNLADKRSKDSEVPFSEFGESLPDGAARDELENVDLKLLLDDFLSGLDTETRVIFVRRYFFFDSLPDIAADLNVSQGKVKTLLFRTRKKLKGYLTGKGSAL